MAMKDLMNQRRFTEALQLFKGIAERDAVLYDVALNACAQGLLEKEAWEIWNTMPANWKTAVSYSKMIWFCGRKQAAARAEQLWEEMLAACVEPDIITYNSLISAYGMAKRPSQAIEVFERARESLPEMDAGQRVRMYSAVMSAVARGGDYAKTREFFVMLTQDGIAPNNFHVNALMTSCALAPDAATAQAIFNMMPSWNLKPRLEEYSILLSCCRQDLPRCHEILSEVRQADLEPGAPMHKQLLEAHVLAGDGRGAQTLIDSELVDRTCPKVQRLIRDARDLQRE